MAEPALMLLLGGIRRRTMNGKGPISEEAIEFLFSGFVSSIQCHYGKSTRGGSSYFGLGQCFK